MEMASNYNEDGEEAMQTVPDNLTYTQLWQEAQDVDDEVQRILREHAMPINDDELEHAEEVEEDDGIQWVMLFKFLMRFSFVQAIISNDFFLSSSLLFRR